MKYLLSGLGTMVAGVITFLIIYNFVAPSVITGTDTGSTLLKTLMPLIVAAIVMMIPILVMVRMWSTAGARD